MHTCPSSHLVYIHTHFRSCTTETGCSLITSNAWTRAQAPNVDDFLKLYLEPFDCFCQNKLYAQSQLEKQPFAICSPLLHAQFENTSSVFYLLLISLVAAACTTNSNGCTLYWCSRDGPSPSLAPAEVAHSIRAKRHARHLADGGLDSGSLDTISANLAFRCRKSFTVAAQKLS
jgi:hypothetical protein